MIRYKKAKNDTDLERVENLQKSIFDPSELVPVKGRHWFMATDDGKPIAFAGLRVFEDNCAGFMCLAGVIPDYRGRGIQKQLIRRRVDLCKELGLPSVITYTTIPNHPSSNSLMATGFRLYEPEYAWMGKWVLYWRKEL